MKLMMYRRFVNLFQKKSYHSVKWTRFPFEYEFTSENKTKMTKLPSGLRVVTHQVPGPTATIGFFIDSGSRAETEQNNGVAHFFEHMAFKGTTKLSQLDMENMVENMGARLFAYTSREQTVYYAKCFSKDGEKIVEVLSDIIQKPLLSENAIERERDVILREMEDIDTQINEVIFDHLHSSAYQTTPLSYTILGPTDNIKRINRQDLEQYIKKHYTSSRIVLLAVGDVVHDDYVKLAQKFLSGLPETSFEDCQKWYEPAKYLGSSALFRNDDMPYAHVIQAFEGVPPTDPSFMALMIATTYLGSWDQSCTLGKFMPTYLSRWVSGNDTMRSYSAFYAPYKDTALWGMYYTGKRGQLWEFCLNYGRQLKWMQRSLTDGCVTQAKNALKTNLLMQLDGTTPLFEEIGRQILTYGRRITNEEFEAEIDLCTSESVQNALRTMIMLKEPVIIGMGPIEDLPAYLDIRRMAKPIIT